MTPQYRYIEHVCNHNPRETYEIKRWLPGLKRWEAIKNGPAPYLLANWMTEHNVPIPKTWEPCQDDGGPRRPRPDPTPAIEGKFS